jgi:penicillin-binding protein 2A
MISLLHDSKKPAKGNPIFEEVCRMKGDRPDAKAAKRRMIRLFTWKWFLLVIFTSFLFTVGGCSAIMLSAEMYGLHQVQAENMPLASKILDKSGNTIAQFGYTQREYIDLKTLQEKNPMLLEAFVKVEDHRFWNHIGVDFYSLGRALVANLTAPGSEGGSTLTMQVCKNVVLKESNKTMTRKIKEFGCALNLESEYSKEDILESYLNYIDFGGEIAGVQMAAKVYFGVDLKQQTLPLEKVAVLAGMPKAPSRYQPVANPENAIKRRNVILLDVLSKDNDTPAMITREEAEKLAKKPLGTIQNGKEKYIKKGKFDAYKDLVAKEIERRYDIAGDLQTAGLKIKTGLDPHAQEIVEQTLSEDHFFVNGNGQLLKNIDCGITMIDPATGLIRAIGGGRYYQPKSTIRALEKVAPGSAIKPLTVYAPAIEEYGYHEDSILHDTQVTMGDWQPKNASGGPRGEVRMGTVVEKSLNLATIQLLRDTVTLDVAFDYAQRLGLPLQEADRDYAPLALGALSKGVSTVEMAQAYTVFPNNGWYKPAHAIASIEKPNQEVIAPKDVDIINQAKEVFKPKSAYYMTRMLQEVVRSGTGKAARLAGGRPVAGKTGTNNDGVSAWFVGFTPDVVLAVDVFYPTRKGELIGASGGSTPARIFSHILSATLKHTPKKAFARPQGVAEPKPSFALQAPQLEIKYNAEQRAVFLNWQKQGERVRYEIFRSTDERNWRRVGYAYPGSTGYQDVGIVGLDQWLEQIFHKESQKTYFYKVVAIDTKELDSQKSKLTSNVEAVEIKRGNDDEENEDKPVEKEGEEDE